VTLSLLCPPNRRGAAGALVSRWIPDLFLEEVFQAIQPSARGLDPFGIQVCVVGAEKTFLEWLATTPLLFLNSQNEMVRAKVNSRACILYFDAFSLCSTLCFMTGSSRSQSTRSIKQYIEVVPQTDYAVTALSEGAFA
jgi:hypothetical protein